MAEDRCVSRYLFYFLELSLSIVPEDQTAYVTFTLPVFHSAINLTGSNFLQEFPWPWIPPPGLDSDYLHHFISFMNFYEKLLKIRQAQEFQSRGWIFRRGWKVPVLPHIIPFNSQNFLQTDWRIDTSMLRKLSPYPAATFAGTYWIHSSQLPDPLILQTGGPTPGEEGAVRRRLLDL